MNGQELSTAPFSKSKKRESAIKGKENKPSAISTGLFACERPRGRVGVRKRLIRAAVEDALRIFCGTRKRKSGKPRNGRDAHCPSFSDEQLWAKFAWKFGWGLLRELTLQGEAEMKEHRKPVADKDKPKILQRLINPFWRRGIGQTKFGASGVGGGTLASRPRSGTDGRHRQASLSALERRAGE